MAVLPTHVTITETDGTVYAIQSPSNERIISWLAWYVEMDGQTQVGIGQVNSPKTTPEVHHD